MREHASEVEDEVAQGLRQRTTASNSRETTRPAPSRVRRIGRTIIRSNNSSQSWGVSQPSFALSNAPTLASVQRTSRPSSPIASKSDNAPEAAGGEASKPSEDSQPIQSGPSAQRTIRFPDEHPERPPSTHQTNGQPANSELNV